MKLEYIVVSYWALLGDGQVHGATLKFFSLFTTIQTIRSHNSTLVQPLALPRRFDTSVYKNKTKYVLCDTEKQISREVIGPRH